MQTSAVRADDDWWTGMPTIAVPSEADEAMRIGPSGGCACAFSLLRTATFSSSSASKSSQKRQSPLVGARVIERLFQTFRAPPETFSFFIRHFRLQHVNDPAAAEHTRQRQRDPELLLIAADRDHRALV